MKKLIAMLLAACLILCITACGTAPGKTNPPETTLHPETEATEPTINMDGAVSLPDVDCTGGWMISTTEHIILTGDFEMTYAFDYNGYLGIMNPWENVVIEFFNGEGDWLTIVCNGDAWSKGDKWLKPSNSFTVPDNVDPMEILAEAKAVVTVKRVGSKITLDGTFTKDDLVGKWHSETDDAVLPETLKFRLGGEYCKLTNIKALGIPEQPINNIT